jgi:predicted DCC family thiol-disulfide oxidoreductase YuxK
VSGYIPGVNRCTTTFAYPLRIFYDGACRICSYEMARLMRRNPQNRFQFIDIADGAFNASSYDLAREDVTKKMHVLDNRNRVFIGIDAFIQIESAFPPDTLSHLIGHLLALPVIYPVATRVYAAIARYRHLLPSRKTPDCENSHCRR